MNTSMEANLCHWVECAGGQADVTRCMGGREQQGSARGHGLHLGGVVVGVLVLRGVQAALVRRKAHDAARRAGAGAD